MLAKRYAAGSWGDAADQLLAARTPGWMRR